jgi:protein-S-isoprenylcysteine O-methyltransferase Ste14
MLTTLRHFLSILVLPFLVVVGVPYWLYTTFVPEGWNDNSLIVWFPRSTGMIFIVVGFTLFCWCVSLFVRVGKGTLAPWDPTRNLVVIGPYRFIRNPMISGVALMLFGQALFWGSWRLGIWAFLFVIINHIYFVFFEEPGLEKRFGENYHLYKVNVPRWIPRLRSQKFI